MFTGIVEELGTVLALSRVSGGIRLTIGASRVLEHTRRGDSIAIEGVCQTTSDLHPPDTGPGSFTVMAMGETLAKTTLGRLVPGSRVNLERALRVDSRLGGHLVQGHVSGTVPIRELRRAGENVYLAVELPGEALRYCLREGSITLDGMSLTIADIRGSRVWINIIPLTFAETSLGYKKPGDPMNLETDLIGRYVERLFPGFSGAAAGAGKGGASEFPGITAERLGELGYFGQP